MDLSTLSPNLCLSTWLLTLFPPVLPATVFPNSGSILCLGLVFVSPHDWSGQFPCKKLFVLFKSHPLLEFVTAGLFCLAEPLFASLASPSWSFYWGMTYHHDQQIAFPNSIYSFYLLFNFQFSVSKLSTNPNAGVGRPPWECISEKS